MKKRVKDMTRREMKTKRRNRIMRVIMVKNGKI